MIKENELEILEYTHQWDGKRNILKVKIRCFCGNIFYSSKRDIFRSDEKQTKSCGCARYKTGDLTNKTFSFLIAVRKLKINNSTKWKCLCICGNTCIASPYDLVNNRAKSCGCMRAPNIEGLTFNRLTVIGPKVKFDTVYKWPVKCSCGSDKEQYVDRFSLTSGNTKSCGCISKEQTEEFFKKYRISKGKDPNKKLSDINKQIRVHTRLSKPLGKQIRVRDNKQCQLCGLFEYETKEKTLDIHHIIPLLQNPSLGLNPNNLICLCHTCHSQSAHPNGGRFYDKQIANFLSYRIKSKLNM